MLSPNDYRAVLRAIDEVRVGQREMAVILSGSDRHLTSIEASLSQMQITLHDTNTRISRLQQTTAEIKELLIRWLDR